MEISTKNTFKKWLSSKSLYTYYLEFIKFTKTQLQKLKDLADTNYQLGVYHLRQHNMADAELRFRIVLFINPNHTNALYNLAKCLFIRNKKEKALAILNTALKLQPKFPEAEYLLNVMTNNATLKLIPISIIEEYFDSSAEKYDEEFNVEKGYKLPENLLNLLFESLNPKKTYSVLDVGCGTGQCGLKFVNKLPTPELYGIDISKNMLNIASKITLHDEPIYKKLIHQDYQEFLTKTKNNYDIIIAGLSLHYQSTLSTTLKHITQILNKHGYVAFSVEKVDNDNIEFKLNGSFENFCYNEDYITQEIKKSGLKLVKIDQSAIKNDRIAFICICTK
jgi:predicted TPR repeat methyltransferase